MTTGSRAAFTLVLTAIWIAGTFALLGALGPDWSLYPPATCLSTHCFCEAPRSGQLLLQPANSWSSFGFVLVGSWIMLGTTTRPRSALTGLPALWFGFTAIIIGVGSVMLHATLTLWGQFADVLGMYLLGSFILVWAVRRWQRLSAGAAVAIYAVVAGGLIASLGVWPESRRWLFAVVLVTAMLVEWWGARPHRQNVQARLFLGGLAANLIAFAIWIVDQKRLACAADSPLQGHAAWHLLGAVAVALTYAYYRSETEPVPLAGRSVGMDKAPIARPDTVSDHGPELAGNPAAGNPDGIKSADIEVRVVPDVENDDEPPKKP